jgi:hypothetical protein
MMNVLKKMTLTIDKEWIKYQSNSTKKRLHKNKKNEKKSQHTTASEKSHEDVGKTKNQASISSKYYKNAGKSKEISSLEKRSKQTIETTNYYSWFFFNILY